MSPSLEGDNKTVVSLAYLIRSFSHQNHYYPIRGQNFFSDGQSKWLNVDLFIIMSSKIDTSR